MLNNLESLMVQIPNAKQLIKIIKNSANLLNFLVNDILDQYQFTNNKFKPNYKRVKVKKLIIETLEMF